MPLALGRLVGGLVGALAGGKVDTSRGGAAVRPTALIAAWPDSPEERAAEGDKEPAMPSDPQRIPLSATEYHQMPTKGPPIMRHHTSRTEVLAAARIRSSPAYSLS
jgi:hypothetical protein